MRISFVLPPVNLSGGIRVISIHAKWLAQAGHDVTLVSPPSAPLPYRRRIKSLLLGAGWSKVSRPVSHLDGLGLNHRVLERHRVPGNDDVPDGDVVVATWWETAEWVDALAASKGAKAYFIQHHEIHSHLPVERCRATYRLPFHKIVIAQWLRDVMRKEYGDEAVDVVPNSVDHDLFFADPRARQANPTLGILYSPVEFKGVDTALKAISLVRERMPELGVIAFGTYPIGDASQFGSTFEYHRSPPQARLRELYARCDVWVTASRSEGFNLPAMEAMACRTPVVATRTGWPDEAIRDGWNGYLVDIDDTAGLAERIANVLQLPDAEWRLMSDRAFQTVAKSSWQVSSRLFEAALEHACRRAMRSEIAGRCVSDESAGVVSGG